jgi:hypothetical protein
MAFIQPYTCLVGCKEAKKRNETDNNISIGYFIDIGILLAGASGHKSL